MNRRVLHRRSKEANQWIRARRTSVGRWPFGSVRFSNGIDHSPHSMRPPHSNAACLRRCGFSLIEVIMATAFLMGSAIVLAKLAGMGREQSQKAELEMEAQQLCERTLNELLLGLRPFEVAEAAPLMPLTEPISISPDEENSVAGGIFGDSLETDPAIEAVVSDPDWNHSIRMESLPDKPGMWAVTVVVQQADQQLERPVRFALTRWISGPVSSEAFESLMLDDSDIMPSLDGGIR